jgi:hypothetical protein
VTYKKQNTALMHRPQQNDAIRVRAERPEGLAKCAKVLAKCAPGSRYEQRPGLAPRALTLPSFGLLAHRLP